MGEKRGTKALEVWCKRVTDGYPGVKVENMTTSWRDGLAFCAIIHHFRPDLIDFHSLDKRDVLHNNELAFRIAERHLGIPALLDAEDMVEYAVPDRLSMLTYLSQFYQTFSQRSPGNSPTSRTPIKRSSLSPEPTSLSPASQSPPTKVSARGDSGDAPSRMLRRDPCIQCGQPVFLAERLIVSSARHLYHRTCFRCARCNSQLTLANYYETEGGRFCCETCPDEEKRFPDAERAPLATADEESPSSSEPSRPPSVTVDTNDLPSNDACELVHSVESSETEDYAKDRTDQSLSLVQMRRKLFENVPKVRNPQVFDSGQLVTGARVSTQKENDKPENPKADDVSGVKSGMFKEEKEDEVVTTEVDPTKSKIVVEDESSKTTNKVEDDPSESRMGVEGEPSVSRAEECKNVDPSEEGGKTSSDLRLEEDEPQESMDESLKNKETEPSVFRAEEDKPSESRGSEDESVSRDVDPRIRMEEPSLELEVPSKSREDERQSGDGKLSKSRAEDDEKQCGVEEVQPILSNEEDETQSRKEDVHKEEEKNDSEKEGITVLPSSPPVAVETIRKPPVTPRKTSSLTSPRKSSPVVTPRQKSSVQPLSYPAELNPFSDDEEEDDVSLPKEDVFKNVSTKVSKDEPKDSSNPFGSDDSEEEVIIRQKEWPPTPSKSPHRPYTHHGVSVKKDDTTPTTYVDTRRFIPAPANLNPFWDDGEEPEDDEDDKLKSDSTQVTPQKPPVPKPRTVLSLAPDASPGQPSSPFANRSNLLRSSGRFGSANSLNSVASSASTMRRKKHAAPPPPVSSANSTSSPRATSFSPSAVSVPSSPTLSSGRSTLSRSRKSRPAPQPPSVSPINSSRSTWDPSTHYRPPSSDPSSEPPSLSASTPKSTQLADEWQEGKFNKDEINRNKQNQLSAGYTGDQTQDLADDSSFNSSDKSSHGQWKRKKGPAPPRPIPQRRQIRIIPLKELKRELDDIEVLQLELERQGVNLETTIRRKFDENPDASESSMTPDIEDLVLQLFELVNEKNELFRKQAELMYLRRQQRLEEEHADLEYQIRVLMEQPERNKTDSDKAKEEKLIQRLVEVVERRNEIVECLEMDRLREAEEDHSIHSRLELFASKSLALNDAYINDLYKSTPALTCCARKEKKKKKDKTKKSTLRLHKKEKQVDADKDIDETEVETTAKGKKTKKKWF